jgi:hypothetical protein
LTPGCNDVAKIVRDRDTHAIGLGKRPAAMLRRSIAPGSPRIAGAFAAP